MNILPYHLSETNDLLTSRAGLVTLCELMSRLEWTNQVDRLFPSPQSNRGFKPSAFVNSLILMLHEGGQCLNDIRYIQEDEALRQLLGLDDIPQACSIGKWLRRMGIDGVGASQSLNRQLLASSLHHCKSVTLDIDASEIVSNKQSAEWTYNKNKGYMPMIGHIKETGQVVCWDFRDGNCSPASNNLEFIKDCQRALPDGVRVAHCRIDAAGYQSKIILILLN